MKQPKENLKLNPKIIKSAFDYEIEARDKTIEVLMDRIECESEDRDQAYVLFASNIALERKVNDRTQELSELTEQLRIAKTAAEQNAQARADFLARMSHEIRTPMNGILGAAQLLGHSSITADQRSLLNTISRSGTALLNLINEILDFSKLEAGAIKLHEDEFDYVELVEDVCANLSSLAQKQDIYLVANVPWGDTRKVVLDKPRMEQILVNLIGNAIKFTTRGGITVKASIEVRDQRTGLAICVTDTGSGMSPEFLKNALEPFSQEEGALTREHGGTGLGLSIVSQLLNAMGADLQLESTVDVGTVFTMWIPAKVVGQNEAHPLASLVKGWSAKVILSSGVERETLVQKLRSIGVNAVGVPVTGLLPTQLSDVVNASDIVFVESYLYMPCQEVANGAVKVVCFATLADKIAVELPEGCLALARPSTRRDFEILLSESLHLGSEARSTDCAFNGSGRVLVAEDIEANIFVVTSFLENLGYEVDIANNGLEAIEICKHESYPIIVMDMQLPKVDGLSATRLIRDLEAANGAKPAYIIGLTANAGRESQEACLQAGMNNFLAKPFNFQELSSIIQDIHSMAA